MGIKGKMKVLMLLTLFGSAQKVIGQKSFTISGSIKNKRNGESIIGASVKVLNTNYGTNSNEYGFYSISLSPNTYQIVYSSLGKKSDTIVLTP